MRLFVLLALLFFSAPAFAQRPWYEGGTLQKANVEQWMKASPADQLATAGDFVASLNSISDLATVTDPEAAARIFKQAQDMVACINRSIAKGDAEEDQPVAQLVVLCSIMKKQ